MNQNTKKSYVFVPEHLVIIAKKEVLTEAGNIILTKKMVKEGTTTDGVTIYVEASYEVPGGVLVQQYE